MSWYESLNSIKGQISSFASGVLTEGIVDEIENSRTPTRAQIGELDVNNREERTIKDEENWSWQPIGIGNSPSREDQLQKKIDMLEKEKKELAVSLEQLDFDCQQTTDKLVTLKDNLQTNYNELKIDFEKLQKEYGNVLNENMEKNKEIAVLRTRAVQDGESTDIVDLHHKQLNDLKEENARLLLMVNNQEEALECNKNQNETKESPKIKNLTEELSNLQKEHEKLLNNYEWTKNEEDKLKVTVEQLKNNYHIENETLKTEIERLNETNKDCVALNLLNKQIWEELEHSKKTNANHEKQLENFKSTIDDYKNLQIINKELEEEGENLRKTKVDYEHLKVITKQMNEELENLKTKICDYESSDRNNRQMKQELELLRETVEDYDGLHKLNQQMKDELEDLKTKSRNYDSLDTTNKQLKEELELLRKTVEDYDSLKEINTEMKVVQKQERKDTETNTDDLSGEKQKLHETYLNIITENMKRYIDDSDPVEVIVAEQQPDVFEFSKKVETIVKLLSDFKSKTEILEKELCELTQEKNKIVSEKNFEIEKLLKNSEILSQEVITKTQAIKDYEDECNELMKNNDLLITELQSYKNNSGLQTISESNEDNLLMLESLLEGANKRIQDLELIASDMEAVKQDASIEMQTELEYIKKQLNMTGQELSQSKEGYAELELHHRQLEEEKQHLKSSLDKIKADYENVEYKYTEVNIGLETLKEENEEHKMSCKKLEAINGDLEREVDLLQNVVEDLKQKLDVEIANVNEKDVQIRNVVERLQNFKMSETTLKMQLQTVLETKQQLEIKLNDALQQNQQNKLDNIKESEDGVVASLQQQLENTLKNKETIEEDFSNLKSNFSLVTNQNDEFQEKLSYLERELADVTSSRNELIALITTKHQENIQYHAEIQRLNHFLAVESDKVRLLEVELHNLKHENPIDHEDIERKNQEIDKLNDQNNFLREKCEVLAQSLLQEQSSSQRAFSEKSAALEKEQGSGKELERLRAHLVEIEEMYTQELLQAEQKNQAMRAKMNEIEQREKDSSSIYTSVSIRANQQVETLQTQLQLVTCQRDELRAKVSDFEDERNRQIAALTNLQLVLEQFQNEKEKDVLQETERIRRQIKVEKHIQRDLQDEINNLKAQLEGSKQGLQAASRLNDQLEKSKGQVVNFKDEVTKLQDQLKTTEAKCKELSTQSDTKVDKTLIKNLVIGYISSHSNDQNQILKIVATVLDFNQSECDKVQLNKSQQGWLGSILHPQGHQMSQQSLSEAFVRFLENESKPKVLPNLLMKNQVRKGDGSSTSTTPRQSPSPIVLSEVVLPTFVDFGKSRNSSSILKDVLKDNN